MGSAVADLRHLLWFRAVTVRRPRAVRAALVAIVTVAVAAAVVPALVGASSATVDRWERALAPALAALVLVSVAGAAAGGGGRELLARDPASIHPISPVTDHLGALVLAPLNAGWLIQTVVLLQLVALVASPGGVVAVAGAQLVLLAWIVLATTLGQAVGWAVEWVRRGPAGVARVRVLIGAGVGVLAVVGAVPDWRGALVGWPARSTADALLGGALAQAVAVVALLAGSAFLVVLGAHLALLVARRPPRDEGRLETRTHPARDLPASDLAMMRRIDRASVWRSVPLRRGTIFLAVAPGVVALAGDLTWSALALMPGLVASGCVLLFGVNLWCLDGRGLLWRETLPVAPRVLVAARATVLAEILLAAGLLTLALGGIRAGVPHPTQALAVLLALVVVVGQAVSAGLRWSAAHPHAVDLRSARATPAPPLAMVGYSLRLALATTFTGLFFSTLAATGRADLAVALAVVLFAVSTVRILRAARRWSDPVQRAGVVAVVTA
ncbi:hypothetical protein ACFQ0K_09060 [Nocardioides caeni]|uniref:Permease n=1 Tax=Nocardioides caeni TaxID=574700 RepID=A0A4S8N3H8_9ACTN|nr:hypothetical protein [Nocardioides caeni]THV10538.1 hypothetical protein E9934_14560 [Nocardioides caeni]